MAGLGFFLALACGFGGVASIFFSAASRRRSVSVLVYGSEASLTDTDTSPSKEKEYAEFYQQVGECITSWALVEERLFDLCWTVLGTSRRKAAIVYAFNRSLSGRLRLSEELVAAMFPKPASGEQPSPEAKAWKEVRAKFTSLLPIRNALAHRPVAMNLTMDFDSPELDITDSWVEVYEAKYDAQRGGSDTIGVLKIENLKVHLEQVKVLAQDILAVTMKAREVPP